MSKKIKWLSGIIIVIFVIIFVYLSQLYQISKDNTTATRGILFKDTLNLKYYKNIGRGFGALGTYTSYTRSDRHDEVIVVYQHFNNFLTK